MLHARVQSFLQTLALVCCLYFLVSDLPKSMLKFINAEMAKKAPAKRAREKNRVI